MKLLIFTQIFMSVVELSTKNQNPDFFHLITHLVRAQYVKVLARRWVFEEDLIIPNPKLTLLEGAIAPWRTVKFSKYLRDLVRVAPELKITLKILHLKNYQNLKKK